MKIEKKVRVIWDSKINMIINMQIHTPDQISDQGVASNMQLAKSEALHLKV